MVVGQPIVGFEHFAQPTFEDRFSTFDISRYSDKTWPTDVGLLGQWHENWVPNQETQKYVSQDNLPPDSWSPFTHTADGLRIRAEEIPAGSDHQAWSLMKKHDPRFDGDFNRTTDYPGFPNFTVPWLPYTPVQGIDYQLEPQQTGASRVLWLKYAQKYRSGILTTREDRASINQGMAWFVAKLPSGGFNDGSGGRSYRHRSTGFPALWLYQQIRRNRGRNNEPRTPGLFQYNDPSLGTLDEFDVLEQGSARPSRVYQAAHVHKDANFRIAINHKEPGESTEFNLPVDPTTNFYVYLIHITPENVGMAMAPLGDTPVYTRVFKTRRPMYETRRTALLDPADNRNLLYDSFGQPVFLGEQLNDDGTPRLPDMMVIMNLAMDGQWLLNLMDNVPSPPAYATLGDGRDYCDMTIRGMGINPLISAEFIRPSGKLYKPHAGLTPLTANPWDSF